MASSVQSKVKSAAKFAMSSLPLVVRRRAIYAACQRNWLHLNPPRTFNEKVNWRVINDRRPLISMTCDKLRAKSYAAERGVNPPKTLWSGVDVDELASVELPEHWVLKPNHRTGIVHIGRGRPNIEELRRTTRDWLAEKQWSVEGEWAYMDAEPCLVAEEFIGEPGSELPDFKFFVIHGRVELVQVDNNRFSGHVRRLYSRDWQPYDVEFKYPLGPVETQPACYEDMVAAAELLGENFDMIRVDLYCQGSVMYFGELSPYPDSGRGRFKPRQLDEELGRLWRLPDLR